jgi:small conductance mechanosensitive channel
MKIDPAIITNISKSLTDFGFKIVGALLLWLLGKWLIQLAMRLVSKALKYQNLDSTVVKYLTSALSITLQVILVVAILGFLGIETTSFAALLAAAGVAIGAAWGGLLANFAAGAFLIVFRPFKLGDFISAGGVVGTVEEIGLFVTSINTPDNVRTIIGNNKIFSDNIQNFSTNPYRRVELVAQLAHSVNCDEAINLLKEKISQIPNVLSKPAPDVEILEFNLAGPVLAVRPYCNNNNYWQVYFDTNKIIRDSFGSAGYPVPEHHYRLNNTTIN